MKNFFYTLTFCIINSIAFSQSEAWTKTDRTNLYDDCMSTITKYKNTSNDQRESISLCYIGDITKKYSKSDFQAMIDIEIKRVKDAVINQCAKNLGIELNLELKKEDVVVEKKEVEPVKTTTSINVTKDGLIGKWKSANNSIIEFRKDGSYSEKYANSYLVDNYPILDNLKSGDWFLDDKNTLTIRENCKTDRGIFKPKIQEYTDTNIYKFSSFTKDYIKYERVEPGFDPIQCNRIE